MLPDQQPPGAVTFAEIPEPRCLCLLLLGTPGSIAGQPITELDAGISEFYNELHNDSLAIKRIEVALMSFGPARLVLEFNTANCFFDPQLVADGNTPIGEAIRKGIDLVETRKEQYRANGISFYRPWIFLLMDVGTDR